MGPNTFREAANMPDEDAIDIFVQIEATRLQALADLTSRFVTDRIGQDPTGISFDPATGAVLGALSDAARAAKLAIAQRIILKGGEDPGWGH
jgi:hypothetical protein